MIRNFIYEVDTGVILSLHATNTGCSEALSSHYSGKPSDYPNDRAWEQRKFPQLCKPEDIIGTKLDDWSKKIDPQVFFEGYPCSTRFVLFDPIDKMILAAYSSPSETELVAKDYPCCTLFTMMIPETISNLILVGSQITDWTAEVAA